jgi:hypothetical protein
MLQDLLQTLMKVLANIWPIILPVYIGLGIVGYVMYRGVKQLTVMSKSSEQDRAFQGRLGIVVIAATMIGLMLILVASAGD